MLLLVEGEKAEPRLLKHFYSLYDKSEIEIVSFNTNIYVMYKFLKEYYSNVEGEIDYQSIDLVLFLNDFFNRAGDDKLDRNSFSDILLIFDFEPHDQLFNIGVIKELIINFNNSTDVGKLYINYPMLESYKDIGSSDIDEFGKSKVSTNELQNYKQLVGSRTIFSDLRKVDKTVGKQIIDFHKSKIKLITEQETIEDNIYSKLCDIQCKEHQLYQSVFIINTSL